MEEPEKEDSLVAVMRDTVQVMETTASNRAFVSDDENDNYGRQVAHSLRAICNVRRRELVKLHMNELLFAARFDSEDN